MNYLKAMAITLAVLVILLLLPIALAIATTVIVFVISLYILREYRDYQKSLREDPSDPK